MNNFKIPTRRLLCFQSMSQKRQGKVSIQVYAAVEHKRYLPMSCRLADS